MSELDLVIDLSKQKSIKYCERMKLTLNSDKEYSVAYNAYYQGHLDAHCDELTLQKKFNILLAERDKLIEELAKTRDQKYGTKPAVKEEVKSVPALFL